MYTPLVGIDIYQFKYRIDILAYNRSIYTLCDLNNLFWINTVL